MLYACDFFSFASSYADEEQYVGQWLSDAESGLGM